MNVDAKSSYLLALTLLISVFSVYYFFILSLAFLSHKDNVYVLLTVSVSVNKILVACVITLN